MTSGVTGIVGSSFSTSAWPSGASTLPRLHTSCDLWTQGALRCATLGRAYSGTRPTMTEVRPTTLKRANVRSARWYQPRSSPSVKVDKQPELRMVFCFNLLAFLPLMLRRDETSRTIAGDDTIP